MLTKIQRNALPSSSFAVPESRILPIHDAEHVKMAWNALEATKGITEDQRSAARSFIHAAAEEMKIDTRDWSIIKTMTSIEAMSLAIPETPDHPNKMPFSGVLVKLDEPSDSAPHGSGGRRILLTSSAAEEALSSLLGMAVNYSSDMKDHNRRQKIGLIESADVKDGAIVISGFLYASDFPVETSFIQAKRDELGFSFEAANIYVADPKASLLTITKLTFTGAAILMKNSAAYSTTSLAASKENLMDEILKAIQAALVGLTTSVSSLQDDVKNIKASNIEAASLAGKVKPMHDQLMQCADAMEASGIGAHSTRGHAVLLRNMANSMMAEAHMGRMPAEFSGFYAAADKTTQIDPRDKEIEELKKQVANMGTQVADAIAAARSSSGAPERKTLPPRIASLLARGNITLPDASDNGGKIGIHALDAALVKTTMTTMERMELKTALNRANLISA